MSVPRITSFSNIPVLGRLAESFSPVIARRGFASEGGKSWTKQSPSGEGPASTRLLRRTIALLAMTVAGACVTLAANAHSASAQSVDRMGQVQRSELSSTCKPCEDFYRYVNQSWLSVNPLPAEYPIWGVWGQMGERNLSIMHLVMEQDAALARSGKAPTGSLEQKVGDFYASIMDSTGREARGFTPLRYELGRIAAINSRQSIVNNIAHLQKIGVNPLFYIGADVDPKNSELMILSTWQAGLGLPDRDYYLKQDSTSRYIRDQYKKKIATLFNLANLSATKGKAEAALVMRIETRLAEASMDRIDMRDPERLYNKYSIEGLREIMPTFPWVKYLEQLGTIPIDSIIIPQTRFMTVADSLLRQMSVKDWKTFITGHLLNENASRLTAAFDAANFAMEQVLYGTEVQRPLWKRAIRTTDRALGELAGQAYVAKAFPPSAKAKMKQMVANLKDALRNDITKLDWISDATRAKAIEKLQSFVDKIGYPEKWRDYSSLRIVPDNFVENEFAASEFEFNRSLAKLGKPVDKTEWGMTPTTINAYYNASMNEIVFPAGILQPPFFDVTADDAYNYGAIGAVIGHEMTHGFDDQGAKYNAKGNLENWWTPDDYAEFQRRSKCIIEQYNSFTIEDSIHVKGAQVVGESIADLGGVELAYHAYMNSLKGGGKVIDGLTPAQRFFMSYARVWAANAKPEFERLMINTDYHPLGRFRVNGPLSNFSEFAKAFHCQKGDIMVNTNSCDIW